ncbi:YfhO family protein [Nakamurella sp. GG22]
MTTTADGERAGGPVTVDDGASADTSRQPPAAGVPTGGEASVRSTTADRSIVRGGVLLAVVLAILALLIGIKLGPALIGAKTFTGVDVLAAQAPWLDHASVVEPHNAYVGDTVDHVLPSYLQIHQRLFSGDLPLWSSLNGAGIELMAAPFNPTLTPSSVVFLLFPTWWAAGLAKLIQLLLAVGGMMLWLRRLGTSWAAGALAGLLYCGSGFFVAWSGWQGQTGVASLMPATFWAIERFVVQRTTRSGLVISAAVALLLLSGFPAVAGHALYAGALYFIIRWAVQLPAHSRRSNVGTLAGGAAAVLLGIGLSALQVLPMVNRLGEIVIGRRSTAFEAQMPFKSFLTVFFPQSINPLGFPRTNVIESYAFLGMGTIALAVLAILAGRWSGVAKGAVPALVVIGLLSAALVWRHGFWTDWLRHFPAFANNSSGRLRDLVGLAGCALAGIGFHVLLRTGVPRAVRIRLLFGGWLTFAAATVGVVLVWSRFPGLDPELFRRDVILGLGSMLLVAVAMTLSRASDPRTTVATPSDREPQTETESRSESGSDPGSRPDAHPEARFVRTRRRRPRAIAMSVLAVLIVGVTGTQVFQSVSLFWPLTPTEDFYPLNPSITATAEQAGSDRVITLRTFQGSSAGAYGIRTVTGHAFPNPEFQDLLRRAAPEKAGGTNPRTDITLTDEAIRSPLFDRMAASTVAVAPGYQVPAQIVDLTGGPWQQAVGQPASLPLPQTLTMTAQNLRGVRVQLVAEVKDDERQGISLVAEIADGDGSPLARGVTTSAGYGPGWVQIPVAGEDLGKQRGPVTLTISAVDPDGAPVPAQLAEVAGQPQAQVMASQQDGLREVFADASATVWERPSALPRIRWASASVVEPDARARLNLLADPALQSSTVVLDKPGPVPSGGAAVLTTAEDSGDRVAVDVDAAGAGYLVLADPIQVGWEVLVDGQQATISAADHAFGAVWVEQGAHQVEFRYNGLGNVRGLVITAVSLAVAVLALVIPPLARRRRRPTGTSAG